MGAEDLNSSSFYYNCLCFKAANNNRDPSLSVFLDQYQWHKLRIESGYMISPLLSALLSSYQLFMRQRNIGF